MLTFDLIVCSLWIIAIICKEHLTSFVFAVSETHTHNKVFGDVIKIDSSLSVNISLNLIGWFEQIFTFKHLADALILSDYKRRTKANHQRANNIQQYTRESAWLLYVKLNSHDTLKAFNSYLTPECHDTFIIQIPFYY